MEWWTNFTVEHPQASQLVHQLRAFLPPLNFITIHYAYFIVVILVTSAIFWGSSDPDHSISYVDSLFLTVSAMTEAGLNTVNLSQMTTWQQILLWLLILFGGAIWVSIWTVAFRLHVFEKRFEDIVTAEREKRERQRRPGSSLSHSIPFFRTPTFGSATTSPPLHTAVTGTGPKPEAKGGGTEDDAHDDENVARDNPPGQPTGRRTASPADGARKAHEQTDAREPREVPPSPRSRITFADDPLAQGDGGNARTTASVYAAAAAAADTRMRRRNVDDGGSGARTSSAEPPARPNSFLTSKTVGRNAQFHDLTAEEREQLGGCEYRALKILSVVVPLYFAFWQILGCISLGAWIAYNKPEVATSNGLNPWWTGIFFGVSAFNNSGMALLDANVVPFQSSYFVLIVMGAMILAGNTAYPILLRFIFWSMLKLVSWATDDEVLGEFKDTLRFILRYPRRVYTNMFPARQTWWLLFMVCLLNFTDWVGFELLNLGNPLIEAIPVGPRIIDGLFQAIAVRSGGFYLVPISGLYIGLQILYVIMMYISVYPVVITMRHSNVYEERSLGIYADDPEPEKDPEHGDGPPGAGGGGGGSPSPAQRRGSNPSTASAQARGQTHRSAAAAAAHVSRTLRRHLALQGVGVAPARGGGARGEHARAAASLLPDSRVSFVSQQIQGQMAHDIWFLVLAVLAISVVETRHFLGDPVTYSVFNVIFEVVSAYGTVGISTGLPAAAYSFSGGWYAGSKLVLCLVMLRGRHRGLPVALDRAVRLPGEQLSRDEEEDHRIRRSMTGRRVSVDSRLH